MRNQIDLGFINTKQLNRLMEEITCSKLDIIEIFILKIKENMSVLLRFQDEKERRQFDVQSEKVVKELRSLG